MKPFKYTRAESPGAAVKSLSGNPTARYLGGGTNLLDLMKDDIQSASAIVDLTRLDLSVIKETENGISLGATAKNSDTANHPLVRKNFPLLSQAILSAASAQIRNMATNGGNLLQRTRCYYFYDTAMPCNKRAPGSGCGAIGGLNENHAIFGASDKCVATHPSDMAVALAALDAKVMTLRSDGTSHLIPIQALYRLPGETPEIDTSLEAGEMIISIEIPNNNFAKNCYYLKVRERASYAFALVSVAAALEVVDGKIIKARVAMGGVAPMPWVAQKALSSLKGKEPTEENFTKAADAEMASAEPLEHNAYKVELGRRAIVRALKKAAKI